MSQHDMTISNADGATVRADINSALEALTTAQSGASAPSPTFAFQLWADTANALLKQRNSTNTAWITVGALDTANLGLLSSGANISLLTNNSKYIKAAVPAATDTGTDVYTFDAGYDLVSGDVVVVAFGSANTTATPTLENTGGTPSGAKSIFRTNGAGIIGMLDAKPHTLKWDGTNFVLLDPVETRTAVVRVFAPATALVSGDGAEYFVVPKQLAGMDLVGVNAHVFTASSSGNVVVQIHNETQAADMLSTAITIAASSRNDSAAVVDAANDDVAESDVLRFDVDNVGTGTEGLEIAMRFKLP